MRAAFPRHRTIDQRVNNPRKSLQQQALQRIKLRDDFTINQVDGLACVYLSKTEHYPLDSFIGQYIKTRNLGSISTISNILRSTLENYPGKPPVMVNELNAWIDKTLGYRASHPDFLALEEV